MTRKLLDDLIVACHYYILTMEHIIKAGKLHTVAKRKRIAKRRKKKAKEAMQKAQKSSEVDKMCDDELEKLWDELSGEINDVLEGKISVNEEISPIDILLTVEDEQHQYIFAF